MPAPHDPAQVERLTASLEEARETIRDLCDKNEVLVSQLEQLPRLHREQIELLEQRVNTALQRAADTQRQVQEIVDSRIWRLLVRLGSFVMRITGRSA